VLHASCSFDCDIFDSITVSKSQICQLGRGAELNGLEGIVEIASMTWLANIPLGV
jgi:hypothetical protein